MNEERPNARRRGGIDRASLDFESEAHPSGAKPWQRLATTALCLFFAAACLGSAGYMWSTRNIRNNLVVDAIATLERSRIEAERMQAEQVITDEIIRLIETLRAASKGNDKAAEHARLYLASLADLARKK